MMGNEAIQTPVSVSDISIVIGSWGSYNACNDRALGSKWLNLSDYTDWEEITEELRSEGFELDGIDEELFVQDIEGLPANASNLDYTNPKELFKILQESEVLSSHYQYEILDAYLEVRDFEDFTRLVREHGSRWDDDIRVYPNYNWEDYGRELFECCEMKLDERLEDFFDFAAYGRYMGESAEEYSHGIIEVLDW